MKLYLSGYLIIFNFLFISTGYSAGWNFQQIQNSHRFSGDLGKQTQIESDLLIFSNSQTGNVWLIDPQTYTVLESISLKYPFKNTALLSADKQNIYLLHSNGKVEMYDRRLKKIAAEVIVAKQSSSLAVSHDGRYLAVGNIDPYSIVILDASDLSPLKYIRVDDGFGNQSRVGQIYTNPVRETFAVGLHDIPQLWEVSYADKPYPGFSGWEHGYHNESGDLVKSQPFPVRRLIAKAKISAFRFGPDFLTLIGNNQSGIGHVVDVDIRRTLFKIADMKALNLGQAAIWDYRNQSVMASTQGGQNLLRIIETESWKPIKSITLPAAGQLVVSHSLSPNTFVSLPSQKQIAVIDKTKLEYIDSLVMDAPIKELKFDSRGKHLYIQTDKLIEVVDSHTLQLLKRISLR